MAKPRRIDRETLPGRQRPMRPCPADFCQRYIELGWEGICEHYRAGWPRIARWIDECGADELREARAEYVRTRGPVYLHTVRECDRPKFRRATA